MTLTQKIQAQGGNPSGWIGTTLGICMNLIHRNVYRWGLGNCVIKKNANCLDIGCGGGTALGYIAGRVPQGKVMGLDHSPEMIDLAKRLNRPAINTGLIEIQHGCVSSLPYPDHQFDLITAFETIQFWPDPEKNLDEVRRVLAFGGELLIVNRFPPKNSKWSDWIQVKNASEYKAILTRKYFNDIEIDLHPKGWIRVLARSE